VYRTLGGLPFVPRAPLSRTSGPTHSSPFLVTLSALLLAHLGQKKKAHLGDGHSLGREVASEKVSRKEVSEWP
jgi:hypothetical protein